MTASTKEQRVALKMIDKAIRAAGRKLPLRSERDREKMLEYAATNMAEAYQIGAEEAQGEILNRLQEIRRVFQPVTPPSFSPNFDERNGIHD